MKLSPQGYKRATSRKLEHIAVAETALGRPLPKGAEIHHWNGIKTDNRPENLCICPNRSYHMMLHYRAEALDTSGNPNYCKCEYCKEYDDPTNLMRQDRGKHGIRYRHHICHAKAVADLKARSITWQGVR